jgi:hypothetical protein
MKCIKCKFQDEDTGVCTYPFKAIAVGDHKLDKNEMKIPVSAPILSKQLL